MSAVWIPVCKTCGQPVLSRASTARSSALHGAAEHIEDWKGIDERAGTPRGEHDVTVVEYVPWEDA